MSRVLECCAPDCNSNARDNPGLKFFDLMTARASLAEWMVAIDRWDVFNDLMFGGSLTSHNICENHFPNNNETPGTSDATLCLYNVERSRHVKVKSSSTQTSTTPTDSPNPALPSQETRDITIRITPSQAPQLLIICNANPDVQVKLVPESVVETVPIEAGHHLPTDLVNSSLEIVDIEPVVMTCITPSSIKCQNTQETADDFVKSLPEIVDDEPVVTRCITPSNIECESTEQTDANLVDSLPQLDHSIKQITNNACESTQQTAEKIVKSTREIDEVESTAEIKHSTNIKYESIDQTHANLENALPEIVDVKSTVISCISPSNIKCESTQETTENPVNSLLTIADAKSTAMSCNAASNVVCESTQETAVNLDNSLPDVVDVTPRAMSRNASSTNTASERDISSLSFQDVMLSLKLSPSPYINLLTDAENEKLETATRITNKSNSQPSKNYVLQDAIHKEEEEQYVDVQESGHYEINEALNTIKTLQKFLTGEQYGKEQLYDKALVQMHNENITYVINMVRNFLELTEKRIEKRRGTEFAYQNSKPTSNGTAQHVSAGPETASIQSRLSHLSNRCATLATSSALESLVHESELNKTTNSAVPRESADSRKRKATTDVDILLNRYFGDLETHRKLARTEGAGDRRS